MPPAEIFVAMVLAAGGLALMITDLLKSDDE